MTTCPCTRPAGDAMLCPVCVNGLERALAEIPFLIRELDTVITRQTVYDGPNDGSRSSVKPLPFHVAASDTRTKIARTLEHWSKNLIENSCPRSPRPEHTSVWLLQQLNVIRYHADALSIHREITEPVTKARWLIDRPADRWYAGPCDAEVDGGICGTEMYATTGRGDLVCRACNTRYDVQARRDWLLAAAEDQLVSAAVAARAVTWLGGTKLTPTLIRIWADRGRLLAKGHEPYPNGTDPNRTRPLYRVGDVIDLLATTAEKAK